MGGGIRDIEGQPRADHGGDGHARRFRHSPVRPALRNIQVVAAGQITTAQARLRQRRHRSPRASTESVVREGGARVRADARDDDAAVRRGDARQRAVAGRVDLTEVVGARDRRLVRRDAASAKTEARVDVAARRAIRLEVRVAGLGVAWPLHGHARR